MGMIMFYSPSTSGFYLPDIHGSAIPADALEITPSQYQSLMVGQSGGQIIAPGAGGIPELKTPAQGPVLAPAIVTMRQARLALLGSGLLASVEDAINALPEPQKSAARIEWDYSSEVHRNKPFVATLAAALGLTDAQLDGLFIQAAQL